MFYPGGRDQLPILEYYETQSIGIMGSEFQRDVIICDNGYANSEGFLTPYKGVRYHLKEWDPASAKPQNAQEMFNMRHTRARNVVERAFGIMRMHWGIFRSSTYYPVNVQNRLIMACFLLHNFIRNEMVTDPFEAHFEDMENEDDDEHEAEFIDTMESYPEWNGKRDEIAEAMWLGAA